MLRAPGERVGSADRASPAPAERAGILGQHQRDVGSTSAADTGATAFFAMRCATRRVASPARSRAHFAGLSGRLRKLDDAIEPCVSR
jgi:hypothetical protein